MQFDALPEYPFYGRVDNRDACPLAELLDLYPATKVLLRLASSRPDITKVSSQNKIPEYQNSALVYKS